jgi:hypothetical protein
VSLSGKRAGTYRPSGATSKGNSYLLGSAAPGPDYLVAERGTTGPAVPLVVYSTVSSPFMPASLWPSTEQWNS